MPRPPRNLTPADATGTPTDSGTPLPLPKPPAHVKPPRLPPPSPALPAKPGRRGEVSSDQTMTKRIQRPRADPTPAPLPPSPGARDAERWFEQVPTNPAAQLGGPGETTGSHRKSGRFERSGLTGVAPPRVERQWLVMFLIAAIALTIGMILGALLFSSKAKKCEPCEVQPKQ